jgi:hypothetical protein
VSVDLATFPQQEGVAGGDPSQTTLRILAAVPASANPAKRPKVAGTNKGHIQKMKVAFSFLGEFLKSTPTSILIPNTTRRGSGYINRQGNMWVKDSLGRRRNAVGGDYVRRL